MISLQEASAYANIGLAFLTFATLGVLIKYTVETSKLRRTAEDQLAATMKPNSQRLIHSRLTARRSIR